MQEPADQYSCLLANHGDRHDLERSAPVARAPCLPVCRPQNTMPGRRSPNRHADAVEAALTTAEGQAPPPNRPPACRHPSPSSARGWSSRASKPAPRHGRPRGGPLSSARQGQDESQGRRQAVLSAGPARLLWARHQPGAGRGVPQGLRPYHLRHVTPPVFRRARAAWHQACARRLMPDVRAPPELWACAPPASIVEHETLPFGKRRAQCGALPLRHRSQCARLVQTSKPPCSRPKPRGFGSIRFARFSLPF